MEEFYVRRYGVPMPDLTQPPPEEIVVNIDDFQDKNLGQLLFLKSSYEKCLEDIKKRIEKLDENRTQALKNIDDINYLLIWFDTAFDLYLDDEGESEDSRIVELRNWFCKFGNPSLFEYTEGMYTKWLYDQNLHCHIYEGDRNWYYKHVWNTPRNLKQSYLLTEVLSPLSQEKLIEEFSSINQNYDNFHLMTELIKFLHCKVLDDREFEWYDIKNHYVHCDEECHEFDY
jgi:hypothetical protein